jgi:hypothetical protein
VPLLPRSTGLVIAAFLVSAAMFAGCSSEDTAPPVASVSVTPSKARVTIGGPIDFLYRFEVAPEAAIQSDYTVFVQIFDAEGDLFWADDHQPPVPTSSWKPGQVIEYTRSSFVPTLARVGDAMVRVGLYREGERLPLEGPEAADRNQRTRAYRVANIQIAPESERTLLIYKTGWHPEEFPEGSPLSWRWTQGSAAVSFENPRTDLTLFLEYDGRPDVFPAGTQTVTVMVGDQVVHTFAAESAERRLLRIAVPAAALGTGPMAEIRLNVTPTFIPANLPAGGKDTRELGLRVYQMFVDSR